jgi:hypothetical protein
MIFIFPLGDQYSLQKEGNHADRHRRLRGGRIYRQVIEQVKRLILTGQIGGGEQLESVADLSSAVRYDEM